jgi:hypothetical protein
VCAIVDACVATRVFVDKNDPDYRIIRDFLFKKKIQVVYGGKLREEYLKLSGVSRIVRILDQAGIAKEISDNDVEAEDRKLRRSARCRSNDTHVIALALVAKARLLCSADHKLHEDFKNRNIISNPRGRIYQSTAHENLLKRKCTVCKKVG